MSLVTPQRAVLAIALVVLATLPAWVGNSYYINIASQILLWAILALGLNVLVGWAGLTSLVLRRPDDGDAATRRVVRPGRP